MLINVMLIHKKNMVDCHN